MELEPRVFSVLRHLVEHPARLVTKHALLAGVWGDVVVSDAALTSCIRDLRRALGDSSRAPRYIETVHRRGFRFIGPIARPAPIGAGAVRRPSTSLRASSSLVGRDAELGLLRDRWERARDGQRQLVFVTGEPGIGKTTLVDAFLAELGDGEALRIGRGQCVEQYGAGEAYLPVLEALGRLGRETGGERLIEILRQYAPTWLVELPSLLSDRDLEAVQRRAQGATRDRMLRELAEAVDALSHEAPLVLVLEDLHWSDASTIDLLASLARRREPARVLVLGTYRPADVAASAHPLRPVKQELQLHGHCEEIPLEFLDLAAIGEYLSQRFPLHDFPLELVTVLHRSTDGNPLFVVSTIDYLIARGQLREIEGRWGLSVPVPEIAREAPETLAQIVEKHVDRLTVDEQAMLAVASVAGAEFSTAVAAAGGLDPQEGERLCERLARRGQFLRATGLTEWPDGIVAGRYAFVHALYRNVLYARIPLARRVGLHLRTGELLERGHGERAAEIAGELAMHFEHGRDVERAVRYRRQAGEHALRQHGHRESAEHVTRALDLLRALPETPDRTRQELTLQVTLGTAMTALKGYGAREVEQAYARARELCEHVDDPPRVFSALVGLGWFYVVRGLPEPARDVGTRLWTMAEATRDPAIRLAAHGALGLASFYGGEFKAALDHFDQAIALYDPTAHSPTRAPAFRASVDPGVSYGLHRAWTLWALGHPARAAAQMREAVALAGSIGHPFSLAHAFRWAAALHTGRSEREAVQEQAEACIALSTEHGFSSLLTVARFHRGWVLAEGGRGGEGLALMREWVAVCRDIRSVFPLYLAWLAEAYGKSGRPADGLPLAREALGLGTRSGNRYWAAELHRVMGTLTLQAGPGGEARRTGRKSAGVDVQSPPARTAAEETAEAAFREALEIARRQRAKSFELRAATSLSRLWARQGRESDAHALLSDVYGWFTEGFDTTNLREAKALLGELERAALSTSRQRRRPSSRGRAP